MAGFLAIILLFYIQQNRTSDFFWAGSALQLISILDFQQKHWSSPFILLMLGVLQLNAFNELNRNIKALENFRDLSVLPLSLQRSYNFALDAIAIREKLPTTSPSILSASENSMYLGYYTGFPVFGTFYWENLDGMLRSTHLLYRRKNPQTNEFPLIREFLTASKVETIYLNKEGYNRKFSANSLWS